LKKPGLVLSHLREGAAVPKQHRGADCLRLRELGRKRHCPVHPAERDEEAAFIHHRRGHLDADLPCPRMGLLDDLVGVGETQRHTL